MTARTNRPAPSYQYDDDPEAAPSETVADSTRPDCDRTTLSATDDDPTNDHTSSANAPAASRAITTPDPLPAAPAPDG
ncbi:hypothetical protein [Cellulomonas phragmiteti]|uniref:hypothetical protein n=1 Tax=Cellulomonas phragmiteti TaxID=478780 RepID=UPI001EF22FA4|nr:hypothetical protein [Cellulomonas phragmiteti]